MRSLWMPAAGLAASMLVLAPPAGAADTQPKTEAKGAHAGGKQDAKPVLFSADEVSYDDQLDLVIARGHVELSQAGRTLLADVVSYNQRTDTVVASGNVSVIEDATGATTFGNYIELSNNMRDGFIKDVRMLMADRSRLAGNTARRVDANRTDLMRGLYSPCDLCATDPSAPPLWQIRAARISHDKEEQLLEFYDATLEIDGVPVGWVPYVSHPDPTVKRKSGFLTPTLGSNTILGLDATVPYYWVLGKDADITFSPIFTSEQSTVLSGDYRQRFANGYIDAIGSITDSDPNPGATAAPGASHNDQLRGHIFAKGEFDIDDNLRTGFDVQRTSDIIYLQEYKFGNFQNFLNTSAFLEDFNGRDYGSVFAYDFQSLQTNVQDRTQPIVLPVADYTWAGRPLPWGGRFTTTADALDLVRETGSTDRRLSLGSRFDFPFDGLGGQKFNFLASMRGDGYYVLSQALVSNGPLVDGGTGRVYPQMGLEWRYPWVRQDKNSTWTIEPKAAVYAAPVGLNPAKIPNDDSIGVDFNDEDLFTPNRFVGFDQVDSGQRIDYALHANWSSGKDRQIDILAGQSYRFQQASPFAVNGLGDGLVNQMSDYVGRVDFAPLKGFDVSYHFRFAEEDLRPARQEVTTHFNELPVHFSFTYLQLGENLRDDETPRTQISTAISLKTGPYWTFTASGTHDLSGDAHLLAASVGAQYTDECTTFIASVGQDGTVIGNFHPGTTVLFQLILKNLGEINLPATIAPASGS